MMLNLFHTSLLQLAPHLQRHDHLLSRICSGHHGAVVPNTTQEMAQLLLQKKKKSVQPCTQLHVDTMVERRSLGWEYSASATGLRVCERGSKHTCVQFVSNTDACSPVLWVTGMGDGSVGFQGHEQRVETLVKLLRGWKPSITAESASQALLSSFLWIYHGYRVYKLPKQTEIRAQSCQTLLQYFLMEGIKSSTNECVSVETYCEGVSK
uniref:Uncharacterized protein n=1 Tax=Lygus hesperus TaxID=30085 RepID=A0A146MDA4_LYGHE